MADYKALYRKWRPFDFDDVCGQKSITDILKYQVANDKVSHAYLFCGSRGTGKTSCAKILAKAVNCLDSKNGNPCNRCAACRSIDSGASTDVIEMDAASNNGVDDVRILKDEISFTPAQLKYRVYIIDEVHMMSQQAFNALLKTLEEPPYYVVFILATTEYNKLPTTIVSRCQRFDFRRMTSEVIVERLKKISKEEGFELSDDGARLIARASRGGMRDAVSLLELCAGSREKINAELVVSTFGTGDRDSVYKLVDAISEADYSSVYSIVEKVVSGSSDISVFWQEIIDTYRDIMVVKNSESAKAYLDLTDGEYEVLTGIAQKFSMTRLSYHTSILEAAIADMLRSQNSKRSIAEIALTKMCDPRLVISPEALALRVEELEKQLSMIKMGATPVSSLKITEKQQEKTIENREKSESGSSDIKISTAQTAENPQNRKTAPYQSWDSVVERIGELKPQLASGLRKAQAYFADDMFLIRLDDFFASRLQNNEADMAILRGAIAEKENKQSDNIRIKLEAFGKVSSDFSNEIENALKF